MIVLKATVIATTEKALLVEVKEGRFWFPASRVTPYGTDPVIPGWSGQIEMPDWLWDKRTPPKEKTDIHPVTFVHATEKALLVEHDGTRYWLPRSQVMNPATDYEGWSQGKGIHIEVKDFAWERKTPAKSRGLSPMTKTAVENLRRAGIL